MDTIPDDVIFNFLKYLRFPEMLIFLSTSSRLWILREKPSLWQSLLKYWYPQHCDKTSFRTSPQHLFMSLYRCCHVQWNDYEMMTCDEDVIWSCILGYLLYSCHGCNIALSTYPHPDIHLDGNVCRWDIYIRKHCIVNIQTYLADAILHPCYWYTIIIGDNIWHRSYGYVNLYAQPTHKMLSVLRTIIPGTGYQVAVHEYRRKYFGARIKRKLVSAFTI